MALRINGRVCRFVIHNKRYFMSSSRLWKHSVRVRFAPSPTGQPHLGSLRTALYNYCFAKKNGGKFILRIEDTDQKRIVPEAVDTLNGVLDWAGLTPDEGPVQGGEHGPYIQSKRLEIYREHYEKLLQTGAAYRCFCSDMRLDLLRKEAQKRNEKPGYDNKCRHLTPEDIKEKLDKSLPNVIRLKMTDVSEEWDDIVYGTITMPILEGDPVIIKSDGFPTYHFANVVDDHLMNITHIIRGKEWQTSTPKHLQLYKAFGWKPPEIAHIPLIMGSDGTKLSKRHGDVHVTQYQAKGYHPKVVLNFVTSSGGGFGQSRSELIDLNTMVDKFDLTKLSRQEATLNPAKLGHYNTAYLQQALNDKDELLQVISHVKRLVSQRYKFDNKVSDVVLTDEDVIKILKWSTQGRIQNVSDLLTDQFDFLWTEKNMCLDELKDLYEDYASVISSTIDVIDRLKSDDVDFDLMDSSLRQAAKTHNIGLGKYMKVLRHCFSNCKDGPRVAEMIEIMGKTKALNRLHNIQNEIVKTIKSDGH